MLLRKMFYPAQVLSNRRKGPLAACWFAATNEKLFKKYYDSDAIKKMNIVTTCEMILLTLPKFSLYLSSQMMCGVTKILLYQIIYCEKELIDIYKILTVLPKKPENEFDTVRDFDHEIPTKVSLPNLEFLSLQIDKDLHILPGEIPDNRMQVIMQGEGFLSFGALTDKELDLLYNGDIALEMRKKMHITDDSTQRNTTEMGDTDRRRLSARVVPSPTIMDISKKSKSKEELTLTPKKRQLHQPRVETPTKRRRLSFEDTTAIEIPGPLENVSIQVTLPVEEREVLGSSQCIEQDMLLESINAINDTFVIKEKTKKKCIDKKIKLDDKKFRQQLGNIKIGCKGEVEKVEMYAIQSLVTNLFNQPCKKWDASSCPLFAKHITGQFTAVDQSIEPIQLMRPQEIVRGHATLDDYTEQTSKLIEPEKQTTIPETSAVIIPDVHMPDDRLHQKINVLTDEIDDNLEDIKDLLNEDQLLATSSHRISESPVHSMSGQRTTHLVSHEIMAVLETLWHDRSMVKFNELIPKKTYTREDAGWVFQFLLDNHAKKKVILEQANFCSTLWISKYESYSD